MRTKKSNTQKVTVALLAIILVLCCTIGGTLAWLTAKTDAVTNTFTVGDINMDLYEHTRDDKGEPTETKTLSDYKILPGISEKKDPTVEITGKSEDCYVFLQVQEVNNSTGNTAGEGVATKYITYSVDNSVWQPLMDGENQVTYNNVPVYYIQTNYEYQEADKTYNVLTGQTVSYSSDLTKTDIEKLYGENKTLDSGENPQLIFKAFAIQEEAAKTALEAWALVPEADRLPAANP